jgi:hypothetical protein
MIQLPTEIILALYREWSEKEYCAGFLHPDAGTRVVHFRTWLAALPGPVEGYERDMLVEYHRQEQEELPRD